MKKYYFGNIRINRHPVTEDRQEGIAFKEKIRNSEKLRCSEVLGEIRMQGGSSAVMGIDGLIDYFFQRRLKLGRAENIVE